MSKPSLRVHLAATERGFVGTLLRRFDRLLEPPPASAYGVDEASVLAQLELAIVAIEASGPSELDRYLWQEEFAVRRVDIEVHPDTTIGRRRVIGASVIPLRLAFAYCELDGGGVRCLLPRLGWWFILESIDLAAKIIENAVSSSLLGSDPTWVFDYRYRGEEKVVELNPALISKRDGLGGAGAADPAPPALAQVAEELVDKAERRKLPRLAASDPRFDELIELFERQPAPSVLLVGESGVGKTTFVHRLAYYLLDRKRGKRGPRRQTKLWSTSADHIVAGMVYLGMWQQRVLEITNELSHEGDYLRVDRLAPLCAPQSDGSSIADLLAPALEAKEITLICEASERELLACRQQNASFVDQFHIIHLDEPSVQELTRSLEVHLARLDPPIELAAGSMRRALSHLGAFRRDVAFPGKAYQFFDGLAAGTAQRRFYPRDISTAFSKLTGLPLEVISDDVPAFADEIAKRLGKSVVGQDDARARCAKVIARLKAGLDDPERPVGTLLFVGPTGVGKTELARQMAAYLFGDPDRLIRIDMSEYMLAGSAQRLLGAGPGDRSLSEQVRRAPLSVVLLDEIEKAHPEVFDLLLGVLGEGRLTDASSRLVDFRMTVIAMTSNLGASRAAAAGFGETAPTDYLGAVRRTFRPELFARIDHVIEFHDLGDEQMRQIVELELGHVAIRVGLKRRGIRLLVSAEARAYLARKGKSSKLGARPLKRLIEDELVAPLAVQLAATPEALLSRAEVSLEPAGALSVRLR